MMLDMKRTFDEVGRGALHPRQGRADPGQPLLPGGLQLVRGHAGVHGDGEARPAARPGRARGHLGPHRRRHPAVPVGARLPRRPQAARLVPRRAVHPAAHRRRPRPAAGPTSRCSASAPRSPRRPCSKVLGGQMLADVQTFVAALDTMFGGFRERADAPTPCSRSPPRPSSSSPHPSATPCARRPTSSTGSRARGCRSRASSSTGCRRVAAPALSGSRARCGRRAARGPRRRDRPTTTWPSRPPALLRLHADLAAVAARHERARAPAFMAGHPGVPVSTVPASATDIHDLEGLRTVGAALAAG